MPDERVTQSGHHHAVKSPAELYRPGAKENVMDCYGRSCEPGITLKWMALEVQLALP